MPTVKKARRRRQRGFTLVELMAVLAILSLLVAIAVPAVGNILAKADGGGDVVSIELIEHAGELAYLADVAFEIEGSPDSRYSIPTLVSAGYLKLSTDSPYYDESNYVVMRGHGSFVYNGEAEVVSPNPGIEHVDEMIEFGEISTGDLSGDVAMVRNRTYDWTVPFTGKYRLDVWGAKGGNARYGSIADNGSYVSGEVDLVQGSTLRLIVGQQGSPGQLWNENDSYLRAGGGGGGGGSTGVLLRDELLVQAQGGKGGNGRANVYGNHPTFGGSAGGVGYSAGGSSGAPYPNNLVGGAGGGEDFVDVIRFNDASDFTKSSSGDGSVRLTLIGAE